jgi:hypothetical protein
MRNALDGGSPLGCFLAARPVVVRLPLASSLLWLISPLALSPCGRTSPPVPVPLPLTPSPCRRTSPPGPLSLSGEGGLKGSAVRLYLSRSLHFCPWPPLPIVVPLPPGPLWPWVPLPLSPFPCRCTSPPDPLSLSGEGGLKRSAIRLYLSRSLHLSPCPSMPLPLAHWPCVPLPLSPFPVAVPLPLSPFPVAVPLPLSPSPCRRTSPPGPLSLSGEGGLKGSAVRAIPMVSALFR